MSNDFVIPVLPKWKIQHPIADLYYNSQEDKYWAISKKEYKIYTFSGLISNLTNQESKYKLNRHNPYTITCDTAEEVSNRYFELCKKHLRPGWKLFDWSETSIPFTGGKYYITKTTTGNLDSEDFILTSVITNQGIVFTKDTYSSSEILVELLDLSNKEETPASGEEKKDFSGIDLGVAKKKIVPVFVDEKKTLDEMLLDLIEID